MAEPADTLDIDTQCDGLAAPGGPPPASLGELRSAVTTLEVGPIVKRATKPRRSAPLQPPLLFKLGSTRLKATGTRGELLLSLTASQEKTIERLEQRVVQIRKEGDWFATAAEERQRFESSISRVDGRSQLRVKGEGAQFFDLNKDPCDVDDLDPDGWVAAVLDSEYVAFAKTGWGVIFRLRQAVAVDAPAPLMFTDAELDTIVRDPDDSTDDDL